MSDSVINVEGLSKRYLIGHQRDARDGLRHRIEDALRSPWRFFRNQTGRRKKREEFWALRDVSFEVKQGEVIGIIGRNGAGKSTLLKILSRITEPTRGCVRLKGRVASLLEVGTGFHPELTGRENIFLNGAILGMSQVEIKRKFDEIAAFSEVEKFLDTPVKRYSSGMYVRLAFAVAAHLEPEILVIDEVLAVGDAAFQNKCLGKMSAVAHQGRTVLFVSHNLHAVKTLCPKSIYLKSGSLMMQSDAAQVIDTYLTDTQKLISGATLRERNDRTGNGQVRVVEFYVTDSKGEPQAVLKSGCDYTFIMRYEAAGLERQLSDVVASISVNEGNGHTALLFRSNFSNQNLTLSKSVGLIKCTIQDLNLAPGSYNANLFLSKGENEVLDYVIDAAEITVRGGDYFGTQSFGMAAVCKVLSRSDWRTG